MDSPFIQGSVVHDGAELTTLLFVVKQGGGIWRFGVGYVPFCQ